MSDVLNNWNNLDHWHLHKSPPEIKEPIFDPRQLVKGPPEVTTCNDKFP
jgi:hypothetical protein